MPRSDRNELGLVRWIINLIILGVIVAVAAPFIYFQFIQGDAPEKLSLDNTPTVTVTTAAGSTPSPLTGTWNVADGSTAGYRVVEKLFAQSNTAAGRTNEVTGSMTIAGTQVSKGSFTVDMASVKSVGTKLDAGLVDRRDDQFRGRIMSTDQFPTAEFVLTKPIALAPVPADGVKKSYSAIGTLTMHGTTKPVTIPINARRTGNVIAVQDILPITFSDYGIDNPSGGPASVGDDGEMEFLLQLTRA